MKTVTIFITVTIIALSAVSDGICQWREVVQNGDTLKIYTYPSASLFDAEVSSTISINNGQFTYQYSIYSDSSSEQNIWTFFILIDQQVDKVNSPPNWRGRVGGDPLRIDWWAKDESSEIKPNQSLNSFSYSSKNLPALVKYHIRAWVEPPVLEEEPDSVENSSIFEDSKQGLIIGPKALPDNISNPALIDTLQNYLSFSCDTTWITSPGICRSLEAKLENVERQLEQGRTNPARGPLQAFLNEVEALREKQLSSEAYALLYFNGQYLLERL